MTRTERLALILILIAAAAVRAAIIPFHFYAPDQGFSIDLGKMTWADMINKTAHDTHPPLYYALLKIWFYFTPKTLEWAQVLSICFATITLLLIFLLARKMFSRPAGWIALVFAAFTPYQIFWSSVARNHQLLALAFILVVWTSYRWIEAPSRRRWWEMAASLALMLNTNYFAMIILPVWAIAFGWLERPLTRAERIKLFLAALPGLIIYLPWVPVMIGQMSYGHPMKRFFFQEKVWPFLLFFHSIFGSMISYQKPLTPLPMMSLALIFTLIFIAGARAVGRRWSWWLLMIAPPTLPVLIAYFGHFSLAERHINFAVPIFMAYWGASVEQATLYAFRKFSPQKSTGLIGTNL